MAPMLPKQLKFPANQISANFSRRFLYRCLFRCYVASYSFPLSLTSDLIHYWPCNEWVGVIVHSVGSATLLHSFRYYHQNCSRKTNKAHETQLETILLLVVETRVIVSLFSCFSKKKQFKYAKDTI